MTLLQSDLFAQRENLERVNSAIAKTILEFIEMRKAHGMTNAYFHMVDLTDYVMSRHLNIAPDSAGRILRYLRQQGKINYRVENRRASLYRVIA
jgi:transcription initiation factor IIE alpha subunit